MKILLQNLAQEICHPEPKPTGITSTPIVPRVHGVSLRSSTLPTSVFHQALDDLKKENSHKITQTLPTITSGSTYFEPPIPAQLWVHPLINSFFRCLIAYSNLWTTHFSAFLPSFLVFQWRLSNKLVLKRPIMWNPAKFLSLLKGCYISHSFSFFLLYLICYFWSCIEGGKISQFWSFSDADGMNVFEVTYLQRTIVSFYVHTSKDAWILEVWKFTTLESCTIVAI